SRKSELDMTRGPFLRKILIFSVPLMFTGLLQLAYNTADTAIVGRFVGKAALAAVGSTGSLINLFVSLFTGMSMGAGVTVARHIGERDSRKIHECVHSAMLLGALCGVIIGTVGFILCPHILRLMNVPEDVIPLSTRYLKIYFLSAPSMLIYNFGSAIVRSTGDTKRPLIILAVSGFINVMLNIVFVIGFRMGVEGVAIPTVISQTISAVVIVIYLCRYDGDCRLSLSKLRFYGAEIKEILRLGVPAGLQSALFSISNVIIQSNVNSFGSAAMAGISAGSNFDGYIYTCCNAVAQATMTFTSQNVGAKTYENIGKIYRMCILTAVCIGSVLSTLGFIFSYKITGLFSSEPEVIDIAVGRMRFIMPFFIFCPLQDIAASQLRGMGRSFEPMIVSLLGACGLRLAWVFFALPLNRTLIFLYWSYPLSWAATFAVQFTLYFIYKRKLIAKAVKTQQA
ncbi:MAG: MATE family efflux transporter, partial [Clostridia bacterium]|nr:MATE family efflux transporter [Clostridia bacterium]